MVRTHRQSRHILTVLSCEPVMMRPSDAADTSITQSECPASVTTSPLNGRNLSARFAAVQSWRHVKPASAMSWASGSW